MEKLNRENPKEGSTPPLNNIQRIKQEPSSGICYVCGCSTVADCKLYFKPFSNGPYFPFLEHHLTPNGSEHPGPYGDVQACSSCYSKLLKQWDVYERSGTPHHKRQYWLKGRAIGGPLPPPSNMDPQPSSLSYSSHFQIFYPLKKEVLSSAAIVPSNISLVTSYSQTPTFGADQSIKETSLSDSSLRTLPSVAGADALDLSIPSSRSSGNSHAATQFLFSTSSCYVCGEEVPENKLVSIYAKSLPNSPYFPFLITHPKPPKARPMDPSGKVLSCESCSKSLVHQWAKFQRHNVPIPDRCYKVRDWSNPTITSSSSFQQSDKFYCFTCGSEYPIAAQRIVYSKPGPHGNYFSFLESLVPPQNALPLGQDGKALVCSICYKSLQRQLQVYELSGVPEVKRTYKVFNQNDNDSNMLRQHLSNANSKNTIGCYLCGNVPSSLDNLILVDSAQHEIGKMFFSFLKDHQPSSTSRPMDNLGKVLVCSNCYANLKNQWNAWENAQVPYTARHFTINKIKDLSMSNTVDLPTSKSPSMQFSQQQPLSSFLCTGTGCYICGRMMTSDKTLTINSLPKDNEMYFPFLKEYISPPSSKALDESGKALVCPRCYYSLKRQWEAYEASHVPNSQRQYSIESDDKEEVKEPKKCSTSSALHIQVYSPDIVSSRPFENNEPLLTTVPTLNPANLVTTQAPTSYVTSDNTTLASKFKPNFDGGASHQTKIQDPFDQMIPSFPLPISTTCYVCGENSPLGFTYLLNTYPPNSPHHPESEKNLQNLAFFPFISKLSPPNGAQPKTEDGKVFVCVFCYHSLLAQWLAYEHSPYPDDRNCWTRKYNTFQYICYICGITTFRVRVRSLAVCDFPFLLEHPRPPGALTVHGGERVVVCLTCNDSFTAQWNEYERLKLPLSMRKYNWIVLPPPNAPSPTPKEAPAAQKSSSIPEKVQEDSQAVVGGKLLPSSMAGGPGGRSMAAVSPLAYDGGTSSFAAALRKLARQAGDPGLDKELAPRVASPITAPKRPPPPPLYQSSGGGAPIVTIAPTRPVIHSSSQDNRKAMDLSTLSHHNDHHEAKQHPPDKWEETSSHIRSSTVSRNEAVSPRGFQPYGGGTEAGGGPSLPHPFAYETASLPPGYSYHHPPPLGSSAFLPPSLHPSHHFPPHYRMEEPLLVEKYGMLRSPTVIPYHQPPSLLSHPPSFYYRYGSEAILAERIKLEEEHQRSWEERSRVTETTKYNSSQPHPSPPPPLTSRNSPLPSKKPANGPLNLATSIHNSDSWSPWRPHPRTSFPAGQDSDIRGSDSRETMPEVAAGKPLDTSLDHKPQVEMINGFYMRPSPPPTWDKEPSSSRRLIAAEGRRRDNVRMPTDQTFEASQPQFRDHRTSVVRSLLENHPPVPPPPPPARSKVLVPALVSKLDLEEEKLRKRAALYPHKEGDDEFETDEDEESNEDEKMKHLLIISKGPPLPLELSPEKKEFMSCLGLITYKAKIEEQFRGLMKKKYVALLERYPSPTLELETDLKEERSSPLPIPSPLLSEQLSREPLQPQKSSFLSFLDLKPVEPPFKLAYQQMLIAIKEEQARRYAARRKHKHKSFLSRLLMHPEISPLPASPSTNASEESTATDKPLKRKLEGMANGLIVPTTTDSPAYLTKKLLLSSSSPATPPPPPLASSTSTPEKGSTPPAAPPRVWLSVPQRHHRQPVASRKVVLVSDAPQDPQTRQFAQKFHESVLLTTKQQLEQKQQQQQHQAPPTATPPSSVIPEPPAPKPPSFKWPGIETLLEAYEHHLAEQRLEREVLVERCQVLQSENHSLKAECESLSHRMAELLQQKQATDEERAGLQTSIDALKQTLLRLQPR